MNTAQPSLEEILTAVKKAVEKPQLYSPNNAAKELDLSRSKVYDLMSRGLLGYVLIDSERRIPASEIHRIATEGVNGKPGRVFAGPGRGGKKADLVG